MTSIDTETLGERLKKAMKARNVRNQEVADVTGVHVKTVSQWLGDKFAPSDDLLELLAAHLKVSVSWLRYGEKEESLIHRAMGATVARHARNLPLAVREFLAMAHLEMVKAGAVEEEVSAAMELMRSPEVFSFYEGGRPRDFNEAQVLESMRAIYIGAIKPELKRRGRKF